MKPYYLLILLGACSSQQIIRPYSDDPAVVREFPAGKQKQRIAFLEKKLRAALRDKEKADAEVDRLNEEIEEAQLTLIRKQVDNYEKQISKLQLDPYKYTVFMQREMSHLFLKEREALHEMIQTGGSSGAQALLDRILRIITELSDDSRAI